MEILEGIISVRAAVEGGAREIETVYLDVGKYKKRDRKITGFLSYLKARGVKTELCERELIDSLVAKSGENAGTTHGGVIAFVGERRYSELSEILDKTVAEKGFCIFLDGVEDPFNLGYSARALYAFGASGLILPKRDRQLGAGVLSRSSAGASELLATAEFSGCDDKSARLELVEEIKKRGIALCCAAVGSTSVSLLEYDCGFPMILFIGGEKRGISPEFVENADQLVHVPYASSDIRYSLPTATVAAVAGMELMRIRGKTSL